MASRIVAAGTASLSTLLAAIVVPAHAAAQTPLPLGDMEPGRILGDETAEYTVEVPEAGFLTVVVRSGGGEDMRFTVTDDEYQPLPDGSVDLDLGGDRGAEQSVVTLPWPGEYRVLVESYETGGASFHVGGAFLPAEVAAAPPDPDGKPSAALELAPGGDHEDVLDPGVGDLFDWYEVTATEAGTLTVLTRADTGDLRLDLYVDGDFQESVDFSDQDQGGVLGNESLTVDVVAGQTVHVRVGYSSAGMAERAAYRIAAGFIPG
ncbi:MAG: hypothetical protein PVI57_10240 [Gemmatimonadota bacterium]|jgi:hypothetical protein